MPLFMGVPIINSYIHYIRVWIWLKNLVRALKNMGATEYHLIENLFEEQISSGNNRVKRMYDEIIRLLGFN